MCSRYSVQAHSHKCTQPMDESWIVPRSAQHARAAIFAQMLWLWPDGKAMHGTSCCMSGRFQQLKLKLRTPLGTQGQWQMSGVCEVPTRVHETIWVPKAFRPFPGLCCRCCLTTTNRLWHCQPGLGSLGWTAQGLAILTTVHLLVLTASEGCCCLITPSAASTLMCCRS